jgi:hypothetical protein
MDAAGAQLGLEKSAINAFAFFLFFLLRIGRARDEIIRRIYWDKVAVEQFDDLGIGERTRSQGEGAASAAADVHSAIVREKENRPMMLASQLLRFQQARAPADLIKAFLVSSRLPIGNTAIDFFLEFGERGRLIIAHRLVGGQNEHNEGELK